MRTASVRELRQNFPRLLARLDAGEAVTITLRRRAVARLVPVARSKKRPQRMPDLTRRLNRVFGRKVIPDHALQKIMDQNRGQF